MGSKVCGSILGKENKSTLVNKLISKNINWIHYDIMDGIFVKNKSLLEEELNYVLNNTDEHIMDLHLMVADPEKWIKLYAKKVDYITFHYEAESIDKIRKLFKNYSHEVNLGISINPKTNVEQIYEFLYDASHVLVMSVVPGEGGQGYIQESTQKIEKLKAYINKLNLKCFIQVDGGINSETGPIAIKAGATALVSGSYLINNIDDKEIMKKIKGH